MMSSQVVKEEQVPEVGSTVVLRIDGMLWQFLPKDGGRFEAYCEELQFSQEAPSRGEALIVAMRASKTQKR